MNKIIGVTVGTPLSASSVANALKGKKSDEEVVLKDVSPLPHEIKVKVTAEQKKVGEITNSEHSDTNAEFGTHTIAELTDPDWGEARIIFEDGSYLEVGMFTHLSIDQLSIGDTVMVSVGVDYTWQAFLVRGFSGEITDVKVTVSGAMESIYLGSPSDGNSGGSCFDGMESEFIVDRTEFTDDGYLWIYFTNGRDFFGDAGMIFRDDIKAGDRAYISYSYDEAYGEDVPALYLAKGEYKEPVEYTPKADGTVSGIISDGTPITISNDKGALLEVEYNRDISKALEELLDKVKDMVGW